MRLDQALDLSQKNYGPVSVAVIGACMGVNASLTAANLLGNKFDTDAASMLLKAKQENPKLTTLCGFKGDETSIDFSDKGLGPADAMLIAPEISVMASLTEVCGCTRVCLSNLRYPYLHVFCAGESRIEYTRR